jgi:hypothetical protein
MQKKLLTVLLCTFCFAAIGQVSINTDGTPPHPNAMLEIKAINKGLLLPRGDADTRNPALKDNSAKGLLLFDTLRGSVWVHDGDGTPLGWKELQDDKTGMWKKNGLDISSNNLPNGNVAIGLNNTLSRLQVNGNATTNPVIKSLVTYAGITDVRAVEGTSLPAPAYGIGGYFEGGYHGLRAVGNPQGGTGNSYAVYATVNNATVASNKFGMYTSTTGLGNNYGMYINAGGGTANYAVYAVDGNAYLSDSLWLGKSTGAARFDMAGGKGDVDVSEGDFRIGTSTNRLKMGIFTTGTFAGYARIHASGTTAPNLVLGSNGLDIMSINPLNNGTVVIGNGAGITQYAAGYKLNVHGKIVCTEVMVKDIASWPDYVFEKKYKLPSLEEVNKFIRKNKHLPGIPSAADVENKGLALGEMQHKLLQKVEELTLYILAQDKRLNRQENEIMELKKNMKIKK